LQVTGQTNGLRVPGRRFRNGLRAGLLAIGLLSATAPSALLAQQPAENDQPVLLNADELTYDETLGVVTASPTTSAPASSPPSATSACWSRAAT
jgi:hypothetical protein